MWTWTRRACRFEAAATAAAASQPPATAPPLCAGRPAPALRPCAAGARPSSSSSSPCFFPALILRCYQFDLPLNVQGTR